MTQLNKDEELDDHVNKLRDEIDKYKVNKIPVANLPKVRLTKLSDDKFNGFHPNNIQSGYIKEGLLFNKPLIGQSCIVGSFYTSEITEIIDDNTFKTLNSTYKIEYLDVSS